MKRRKLEFKDFFELKGEELKEFCNVLKRMKIVIGGTAEGFEEEIKKLQKLQKSILSESHLPKEKKKYRNVELNIMALVAVYNLNLSSSQTTHGKGNPTKDTLKICKRKR